MDKPVVSICCLTYNHLGYIREALDSFLAQKCDFAFEIIVHDDLSNDGTREIVAYYASKYPDIVKPLFPVEKQYPFGLGHIHKNCFDAVQGEFIALCEGDDYWIDELKLQKQVGYMRANPQCGLVHTANKVFKQEKAVFSDYQAPDKPLYQGNIFDRLLFRNRISTPTTLFRADYARDVLDSFVQRSIDNQWSTTDLPLWLGLAQRSRVGYLSEVTAVYRISEGSISHNGDRESRFGFFESMLDIYQWAMDAGNCDFVTRRSVMSHYYMMGYKMCVKDKLSKCAYYRTKSRDSRGYVHGFRLMKLALRFRFMESLLARRMAMLPVGGYTLKELAEEIIGDISFFI